MSRNYRYRERALSVKMFTVWDQQTKGKETYIKPVGMKQIQYFLILGYSYLEKCFLFYQGFYFDITTPHSSSLHLFQITYYYTIHQVHVCNID